MILKYLLWVLFGGNKSAHLSHEFTMERVDLWQLLYFMVGHGGNKPGSYLADPTSPPTVL